ncbi:hypothetical protein HHSLTHF2_04500 [Vreelandella venusta]|uniref:Uncharacterized protein n=1 Tax=Halomonas hydrothermalis TaxID=115561 RepID=A0A6F8U0Y9_9GAMM|nr:hypothetical protein HHSLTHF2_04500 [Halomonas hydrothermalis]
MARQLEPTQGLVFQGRHQGHLSLDGWGPAEFGQVTAAIVQDQAEVLVGVAIEAFEGSREAKVLGKCLYDTLFDGFGHDHRF